MNRSLQFGFHRKLDKLDRLLRIGIDKILPRNLTVRYIAALTAVGILAVSGQLIIQASLARQSEDQRKLHLLEGQVRDSETLRKAVLSLQLSSNRSEIKNQIELIESLALQFQKSDDTLKLSDSSTSFDSRLPFRLTNVLQKTSASLQGIIEDCHNLSASLISMSQISSTDQLPNTVVIDLLNNELEYRSGLKELSKHFNHRLEQQIIEAKRIELFLLFITLVVLFIEGLYVFRPGVESLYDALRIRSEFLGRMGHEMRNPMNSILGMTNLLLETPLTDQQKKYLSILIKSSTGLLEVLNNLLDFSSIESGRLKMEKIPFDLHKLLEKSIDLVVYGAHANGIELVLDLGPDVPLKLIGDPSRLQQILSNLLGNAVKFTKKGEVMLRVQLEKQTDACWIQFSVIDTGMGIDGTKIDRIFDAFVQEDSTVRRRFGGTGLGLSISKDLVTLLGGHLSVESEKDVGSRFYFTLPFQTAEDLTVGKGICEFNLSHYRALIAEPNKSISETLSHLIKSSGGQVSHIRTTQDLNSVFSSMKQVDRLERVVIVDYDYSKDALPILFSRIRRGSLNTNAFIFLIKTTASSADIEKLAEYGLRNFLFKPVKPFQLIEAIAQGLSHFHAKPQPQKKELIHDDRALRILAVDDSKDNQFLVKAYLESLPYRVTFADNGKIAVDKFKSAQFDLVLMDLQMPEMDGYAATQLIREWEKSECLTPTPIIAVSAHDNESGLDRFRKANFSDYLVKPISPNQLRQTIIAHTHSLLSPSASPGKEESSPQGNSLEDLEKQLAELAPQYLKSRSQEIQTLRTLLNEANFEKIQTLGHRLKGNAKSYGFEKLGLIGNQLEEAAKEHNALKIDHLIQQSETYIEQAKQAL